MGDRVKKSLPPKKQLSQTEEKRKKKMTLYKQKFSNLKMSSSGVYPVAACVTKLLSIIPFVFPLLPNNQTSPPIRAPNLNQNVPHYRQIVTPHQIYPKFNLISLFEKLIQDNNKIFSKKGNLLFPRSIGVLFSFSFFSIFSKLQVGLPSKFLLPLLSPPEPCLASPRDYLYFSACNILCERPLNKLDLNFSLGFFLNTTSGTFIYPSRNPFALKKKNICSS